MSGRMTSVKDLVKELEAAAERFSPLPEGTWELRSQALALRTAMGPDPVDSSKAEVARLALEVSDACSGLYSFGNNMVRSITAKGYTRLATIFDMTTIGTLALNDLRKGNWRDIQDIIGSLVSEGAMIIASLQYTKASEENMKAVTEDHMASIYGMMWEIIPVLRGRLDPEDIVDARNGLDGFFRALRSDETGLTTRIPIVVVLYLVVIKLRTDKLLEKAKRLK